MPDTDSGHLETVFSGAVMLLIGFIGGGVLTLATQVIIARFFSPEMYGVFSQGMSVLYALVMLSMLGLNAGISRYISYHGLEEQKASDAIGSSLAVTLPVSVIIFSLLFFFAEPVSQLLFSDPETATVLKIFSIAGPAMAVNSIFISGFRGYQKSKERVILLDFIIPFLQVAAVSLLIFVGYGLEGAAAGYAAAFVIATGMITYWYRKRHELGFNRSVLKELVFFSWPIMVSALAVQLFLWTPPILVGALASSQDVGMLNTALPLAASTKMFLSSVAFLFMPVVSELFGKDNFSQLRSVHSDSTRWIVNLSVPVLAYLFFFSGDVISFVFGSSYAEAGVALSLMAVGYFFNMVTGPVGETLIASGRVKREMLANLVKLVVFLGTGFLLVPGHGFIGGAAAYTLGMIIGNILRFGFCWDYLGFFYGRNFAKPFLAASAGIVISATVPVENIVVETGFYFGVYGISFLGLKPFEDSDSQMVDDFLENTGLAEIPLVKKLQNLVVR